MTSLNIPKRVAAKLSTCTLGHGVGTCEEPCSIAAINLALSGQLTDKIPDCMSPVIGRWIISIHDAMPLNRLNGPRWRSLLPYAAGTGRQYEQQRLDIIIDWMWRTVLPQVQPLHDRNCFDVEWAVMREHLPAALLAAGAGRVATQMASREVLAMNTYWSAIDPETLLEQLINVGEHQ